MNKEELKGKVENLKGRAKQAAGALTGNKKVEAEGAAQRVTGAAEEKVAQAKETLDDTTKRADDEATTTIDDDFDSDTKRQ